MIEITQDSRERETEIAACKLDVWTTEENIYTYYLIIHESGYHRMYTTRIIQKYSDER